MLDSDNHVRSMVIFQNKWRRRLYNVAVSINREAGFNVLLFNQRKLFVAVKGFNIDISGSRFFIRLPLWNRAC